MAGIRVAIAGVGNCASSLVQGVTHYATCSSTQGLITPTIGQYGSNCVQFVAAFDVDRRKVGRPLHEAIYASPNNAMRIAGSMRSINATVHMGPVLDGIAPHMTEYAADNSFRVSSCAAADVTRVLVESAADVLVCYLPVGATESVRHYAKAALEARVAFINCVPVFIANDEAFANAFRKAGVPLLGDDVRSQVGATIVHQRLVELLSERGFRVERTYQLNVGGNTDFLNMMDRTRVRDKKRSKTDAVTAKIATPISSNEVHIGPSDYVPQLGDTKVAYIRIEGRGYSEAPLLIDLKLEVQDSPNSAGVVFDLIRYAAVLRDMKIGGVEDSVCSYYVKSPPLRLTDAEALQHLRSLSSRHMSGTF